MTPFLLILLIVLVDQLSKGFVSTHLVIGQSIRVLGDFLKITYIVNPGGVFGSHIGGPNFYLLVSVAAIVIVFLVYLRMRKEGLMAELSLGLILGGAAGNLVDRFRFGEVVDFLDFDFFNLSVPGFRFLFFEFPGLHLDRWPVFNLADSAVTVGLLLLVYHFLIPAKDWARANGSGDLENKKLS